MAAIILVVSSIDPLAPYKVSSDLVLELVSATAIVKLDPDGLATAGARIVILEPLELTKHQPPGGYILDDRRLKLTCTKSAGVQLGDEINAKLNPHGSPI